MSLYGGVQLSGHPDLDNVRLLDTLPLPQIRRMMNVGIAIDKPWLQDLSLTLESRKLDLKKEITSYIPPDDLDSFVSESSDDLTINVDSAEQIADLLYKKLGIGYGQRLKRTKSGKRISTGKKQLETLKREHPVIGKILTYREYSKLAGTFCNKLPLRAVLHNGGKCRICGLKHWGDHWRTHCTINTTRTVAGRTSMRNDNLQQIPVRTKMGKEVRKGFVAAPGCKLVTRDYSQLHLRLLAHLANEPVMIVVFERGGDIHVETAMRAFGIDDPAKVDKATQRDPSKTAIFLTIYGGGPATLLDTLFLNFALADADPPPWLDFPWCEQFIEKTYSIYPGVPAYFELQHYRAQRYEITWCPFGRIRWIPELKSCHDRVVAAGLRQAGNHPIIAFEAGLVKIAQARTEDRVLEPLRAGGVHAEAVIPVHDEIVFEVEEDWAEDAGEMLEREMMKALTDEETGETGFRVPLIADGKVMGRWEK